MNKHVILLLLVFAQFTAPSEAADWNQWRGAQGDGVAHSGPNLIEKLPETGLRPVWIARQKELPKVRSAGWSSPVVADGRVYLFTHHKQRKKSSQLPPRKFPYLPPEKRVGMSDEEYAEYEKNRRDEDQARSRRFVYTEVVYCLDAKTGKQVWKNERLSRYTRFAQSGSPAVLNGHLFVLGAGRVARCVRVSDGKDVWSRELPGDFRDEYLQSSFTVVNDVAVVLCGQLFGLNTQTGKIVWSVGDAKSRTKSSPVVWHSSAGPRIVANLTSRDTVCVEPAQGKVLWRTRTDGGNATPVIVADRLITYGSSRKRGLRCFQISASGAKQLWSYHGTSDPGGSPVIVGQRVFIQGERRFISVDLETGKAVWRGSLDIARPRYSSLVAADGKVFFAFDSLIAVRAQATDFEMLMNAKINRAGLLDEEESFRTRLGLAKLEKTPEGQKEAQRILRREFGGGPLPCATPAISDGRIYLRLSDGIACYDLAKVR